MDFFNARISLDRPAQCSLVGLIKEEWRILVGGGSYSECINLGGLLGALLLGSLSSALILRGLRL